MAIRTTPTAVIAILGENYGPSADGSLPDLTPYIQAASLTIDRLETGAIEREIPLTATELQVIETWLSAHRYTAMDPLYKQKSTDRTSGGFVRDMKQGDYLKAALEMDPSGELSALIKGSRATGFSLATPMSEQMTWEDRNGVV